VRLQITGTGDLCIAAPQCMNLRGPVYIGDMPALSLGPGWRHTNCQCRCHHMGQNLPSFNFLYFQLATFHSDRSNIISPVAKSHPHGRGRPGGGGQSARRSWLTSLPCMAVIEWGPAAAVARDDGVKLGSCPSLLH